MPPHNALSKRGLAAVSAAGLNLLGSFLSFRPSMRPWDGRTLGNWWRVRALSRGDAAAVDARSLRLSARAALRAARRVRLPQPDSGHDARGAGGGFEEARRAGGDFCLATHYWEVDARMKDVLLRFLDHASRVPDVRFVTAEALFA